MKALAIDMERKVHLLESELTSEKGRVKQLESQVLAERNVNMPSSVSKRKKKKLG